MKSTFDDGAEGWQIYDYAASIAAGPGENVFRPVTWETMGGVNKSGYIWADDSRWTIDTPEAPHSLLALILYRRWIGDGELDLRNAKVSVFLRGDQLDLEGANCFFWVSKSGVRWHYASRPLEISG